MISYIHPYGACSIRCVLLSKFMPLPRFIATQPQHDLKELGQKSEEIGMAKLIYTSITTTRVIEGKINTIKRSSKYKNIDI